MHHPQAFTLKATCFCAPGASFQWSPGVDWPPFGPRSNELCVQARWGDQRISDEYVKHHQTSNTAGEFRPELLHTPIFRGVNVAKGHHSIDDQPKTRRHLQTHPRDPYMIIHVYILMNGLAPFPGGFLVVPNPEIEFLAKPHTSDQR